MQVVHNSRNVPSWRFFILKSEDHRVHISLLVMYPLEWLVLFQKIDVLQRTPTHQHPTNFSNFEMLT